jgi:hypothetical protein
MLCLAKEADEQTPDPEIFRHLSVTLPKRGHASQPPEGCERPSDSLVAVLMQSHEESHKGSDVQQVAFMVPLLTATFCTRMVADGLGAGVLITVRFKRHVHANAMHVR